MEHLKNLAVGSAAVGSLVLVVGFLIVAFPWSMIVGVLGLSYGVGAALRETNW